MLCESNIAIVGGGSWGTALSVLLANEYGATNKTLNIKLWVRRDDLAQEIIIKRVNSEYLPGVNIPQNIYVCSSIKEVIHNAGVIVIAVPSQYLRSVAKEIHDHINNDSIVCSASKGIEIGSFKRMSEIIHEEIHIPRKNIAVISGPSHAEEVSRGKVTTVVVASSSDKTANYIQKIFSTQTFRIYTSGDVKGVEYGGALKNIIAIGAGICDGLQKINNIGKKTVIGDNTKASLLTRGIEEIARLGIMLGSRKRTFYGLSGWGDLLVTSYSNFGRNRLVGECLAMGMNLEQIKKEKLHGMVPEGVETTKAVYELSRIINVEMPITEQIYLILYENKDIETAIYDLMNRSLKPEHGYYIKGIPKRLLLAWRNRV